MPSQFIRPTAPLTSLIVELQVERRDDSPPFLNELNAAVYDWFDYVSRGDAC